jgi:ubiquinone/menaquinone biosynthesis C-methylase UbiE
MIGNTYREGIRILVVGAGTGDEVLALRRALPNLTAIELDYEKVSEEAKPYILQGDARAMDFPDESFDVIYCYHVLEHIPEYDMALSEMRRLLKKGGLLYLGVPNKSRLIGYICVRENSFRDKIVWNFNDYKARFLGKFENRFGAHAGFTRKELLGILSTYFSTPEDVTYRYYATKYDNAGWIRLTRHIPLLRTVLLPSIYVICVK